MSYVLCECGAPLSWQCSEGCEGDWGPVLASECRCTQGPELLPEVAACIAFSFAVFIDAAHAWVSCDLSPGFQSGGVDAALLRFRQNIDAAFQQGEKA